MSERWLRPSLFGIALLFSGACERPPPVGDVPAPPPVAGSPIDEELAAAGEAWYRYRGCMACHAVGDGRGVGPTLQGITLKREYEWFQGMVVRPDSMLRHDPEARLLLTEYRTPMPNTGITEAQSRAVFEYLRREDLK